MLREGIEDYFRNKADKEANGTPTQVLKNGVFIPVRADEVQVGDTLMIKQDQKFPADLVLVGSSNDDGMCYINTVSMDGEKNLKKRLCPKDIDMLIPGKKE
jgi:P-type E1-E2 ATPase